MDYKDLLALAEKKQQANDAFRKKQKSEMESKGPSKEAIAAFKAKKEKEQLEKLRQAQVEKEKLLSLRAQSGKSLKRSKMMKNRTKDNDFSKIVMTAEMIEEQKRAQEIIKSKELALERKMKTGKSKINGEQNKESKESKSNDNINNNNNNVKVKKLEKYLKNAAEKNNNKQQQQQPISYSQLMNMASEKSKTETKSLEQEILEEINKKKELRPMTQKEKEQHKEELFYKIRAHKGLIHLPDKEAIKKNKQQQKNQRLIASQSSAKQGSDRSDLHKNFAQNNKINNKNSISNQQSPKIAPKSVTNDQPKNKNLVKKSPINHRPSALTNNDTSKLKTQKDDRHKVVKNNNNDRFDIGQSKSPIKKGRALSPPPSPPVIKRNLPPIGSNYRRGMYDDEDMSQYVDDDNDYYDDEDDDDMSDFIDDGPINDSNTISDEIRKIFGYDRRKYALIDDDDDIQESSFVECMKEETRSARIGRQEDLEDMRKEEEEKRRKRERLKTLKKY